MPSCRRYIEVSDVVIQAARKETKGKDVRAKARGALCEGLMIMAAAAPMSCGKAQDASHSRSKSCSFQKAREADGAAASEVIVRSEDGSLEISVYSQDGYSEGSPYHYEGYVNMVTSLKGAEVVVEGHDDSCSWRLLKGCESLLTNQRKTVGVNLLGPGIIFKVPHYYATCDVSGMDGDQEIRVTFLPRSGTVYASSGYAGSLGEIRRKR